MRSPSAPTRHADANPRRSGRGGALKVPPILNIIALASFAASLSARALDPVLPHIAEDFSISIATAAGFASGFAFTFAIMGPLASSLRKSSKLSGLPMANTSTSPLLRFRT